MLQQGQWGDAGRAQKLTGPGQQTQAVSELAELGQQTVAESELSGAEMAEAELAEVAQGLELRMGAQANTGQHPGWSQCA